MQVSSTGDPSDSSPSPLFLHRAWRSYGAFDPSVVQSIANLKTAGFKTIDVYMFPCFKCGNPAGQVNKTLDGLASAGARFGTLWLDIEGSGVYWGSDLVRQHPHRCIPADPSSRIFRSL